VYVRAPEHARFFEATPPPMWISADFARWQPGIASPVEVSQYAVEPSASTSLELWFVLPAQRPASPEIAESPTLTTVGVPTPGPSPNAAAGTTASAASTTGRTFLSM
jgi:hypothetical protein